MKRRVMCILIASVLSLSMAASASPDLPENTAVTLRYIEDVYIPSVRSKASEAAAQRIQDLFRPYLSILSGSGGTLNEDALIRKVTSRINFTAAEMSEISLKAGTVITLGQGARYNMISGSAALESGTLINSSLGTDIAQNAELARRNRYISLSAETGIRVTADAVIYIQGGYRITPRYVPLYTDLCDALVMMDLINTYILERDAVRLEMFVVFLRLIGEEEQALAHPRTHPFTDVRWGHDYVSYAYEKGYTVGTTPTTFSPDDFGTVRQMCLILLRALGYRDGADVSYRTALDDAVRAGLFTRRELEILGSDRFVRDTMIYMTYYSLFAKYKDSDETILDRLIRQGAVSKADADRAVASVTRRRFD